VRHIDLYKTCNKFEIIIKIYFKIAKYFASFSHTMQTNPMPEPPEIYIKTRILYAFRGNITCIAILEMSVYIPQIDRNRQKSSRFMYTKTYKSPEICNNTWIFMHFTAISRIQRHHKCPYIGH